MASIENEKRDLAPIPRGIRSTGTRRSLRPQQVWEADEFRILSIDVGGIRGTLPATILDLCEREFAQGRSAGDYFDLIAGTSTGGIIALGLGKGETAGDILKLYTRHGAEIFPPDAETNAVGTFFRILATAARAEAADCLSIGFVTLTVAAGIGLVRGARSVRRPAGA